MRRLTLANHLGTPAASLDGHRIPGNSRCSHVWRVAEEHVLAPHLRGLFSVEAGSLAGLRRDLAELLGQLPVQRAVLFGSIARGEERTTSDIDLFVQVGTRFDKDAVEDALSAASARFALKFGIRFLRSERARSQVRRAAKPPLVDRILREGIEVRA